MKTATRKKSAGKSSAPKSVAGADTSAANQAADGDLSSVAARLGGHLKALEKEYLRLEAELKKKREIRARLEKKRAANPGWSDEVARRRAARLQRNIDRSGAYVRKQSAFLQKVKAFHERNERLLQMIADRLEALESQLQSPNTPDVEARMQFQNELMGMLVELQSMRAKRESLLTSS